METVSESTEDASMTEDQQPSIEEQGTDDSQPITERSEEDQESAADKLTHVFSKKQAVQRGVRILKEKVPDPTLMNKTYWNNSNNQINL